MAKKSFPDLNKDGKVTKADILKGRGVEGFEDGGSVRRPAPVEEPISDDPLIQALEEERRIQEANESGKSKKKKELKRRGDDEPVETFAMGGQVSAMPYRDGGMVRGCKGIQVKGKKFSGTY
jgi:hypothetical protein